MSAKSYTARVEGDRVYVIELPSGIRRSVSDGRSGKQHVTGAFVNEGTLTINYSDGRVRTFNASTLGRTGSY